MEQGDAGVIDAVLKRTEDLTQVEAAKVLGVSQKTISAWRGKKRPDKLSPKRRRKFLELLDGRSGGTGGGEESLQHDGALARQIDAALAKDGDGWVVGYLVGEIRAAYRDAALKDLAAALLAAEKNAALLSEERRGHREAILRIDENARATTRDMRRDQLPTGADPSPYNQPPEPKEGERKVSGD